MIQESKSATEIYDVVCNRQKRQYAERIVSELAAVDGFSIHAVCKSNFISESLGANGFRLPLAERSIMELVHSQHKSSQKEMQSKIEPEPKCNTRFSYRNDHINLGLMRMLGSCDAEKILELLEKSRAEFGITNMQTYIVSIVSDGASVMKRLEKNPNLTISSVIHMVCIWLFVIFCMRQALLTLPLKISMTKMKKYLPKALRQQS